MIPPFTPDMMSDFPAVTSTNPPLPEPFVVALIRPSLSSIRSASDRNVPRVTGKAALRCDGSGCGAVTR